MYKRQGVVYKRRVSTAYALAEAWLFHGLCVPAQGQIESEIAWFLKSYENIAPAASICYDRVALYGLEDPQLRVTLDENIRYRTHDLSFSKYGNAYKAMMEKKEAVQIA